MAVYRHTCTLKALQRDLPMQPPLIPLKIVSFWHTCLYSGCVHMKKEEVGRSSQSNITQYPLPLCKQATPQSSQMGPIRKEVSPAVWSKEWLQISRYVVCTGGIHKQDSTHQMLGTEGNGSGGHRAYLLQKLFRSSLHFLQVIFNKSASSFIVFSRTSESRKYSHV